MSSIIELCRDSKPREWPAGSVLLSEGETTGHLYVLKSGVVEVLRGNTQVAVIEDPGAVFGEMSALLGSPHTATVRVMTSAQLYAFDDAQSFLRANPDITFFVSRLLASRLNAATTYLADLKRQFEDQGNHLGMVGEVLDVLIHQQDEGFSSGPEERSDPRL